MVDILLLVSPKLGSLLKNSESTAATNKNEEEIGNHLKRAPRKEDNEDGSEQTEEK